MGKVSLVEGAAFNNTWMHERTHCIWELVQHPGKLGEKKEVQRQELNQ